MSLALNAGGEDKAAKVPINTGRQRLAMIVWFRAFAIFLIVAGHSYDLAGIRLGSVLDDTISDLIRGATALFVFISGFIFDYIFSVRYNYGNFILNRVTKLLAPYCVLTVLAGFMFSGWAYGAVSLDQLFRFFVFGDAFQAYWYIPFILLMFTFAPLHRFFMNLRAFHQAVIIVVTLILSGLIQRPVGNDNAFQSVAFYTPVYLSGICLSLHREALLPIKKKNFALLLVAVVLLAVVQSISGQSGNMHKPFFVVQGFELMIFQKLALCFALAGLFSRFSSRPASIVQITADTSFAIFFLHPFVLRLVEHVTFFRLTNLPWIDLFIATTAIVTLCSLCALAVKHLSGTRSHFD